MHKDMFILSNRSAALLIIYYLNETSENQESPKAFT